MYIYYFQSSQTNNTNDLILNLTPEKLLAKTSKLVENTSLSPYRVNSIRPGGGGGEAQKPGLKTSYLMMPKLCEFQFLSQKYALTKLQQNLSVRGFMLLFLIEMSKIFLKWKKFHLLETCWN